jgi:two-component system NarL family sensor kinase
VTPPRPSRRTRSGRRTPIRATERDLRILKEIAEVLNGATDVEQALRASLARVADLLGLHTGWIWLIDPQTGRFYSATAQDLPPFLADPVRMTGKTCWCIDAFRSGELTAENIDVIECSRLRAALPPRRSAGGGPRNQHWLSRGRERPRHGKRASGTPALGAERPATRGLRYHASVPLYFGERQIGIMNVATPAWRKLTRRELDLLSTIASQVGVAIERARLAEESVRLARGEERTRIARDLHDTLTQGLTAIGLHVEAALTGVADPGARDELERALDVTRTSLDEARRALRELRGSPLNGRPLPEAIAGLGRELTAETGVRVHVRSNNRAPLPSPVEEQLFRIASEALTNIRRHAHARDVDVTLTRKGREIRLTIADDGTGFGRRTRGEGFGIEGMRERARLVGGRLVVRSNPGGGTQVVAAVPLDL